MYDGCDVKPLFKLSLVFAGAFISAFFTQDSPSAVDQIEKVLPNRPAHVYAKIDLAMVVLAATAVAYVYNPIDQGRAVISGLGSVALLKQFYGKIRNRRGKK